MKDQNIIIVGLQPWDIEIGSNCKNIAMEFARDNKVLYVNTPLDRYTLFKNRNDPKVQKRRRVLNGEENDLVQIGENIWNLNPKTIFESINWIGSESIYDYLNRINNARFAKCIANAAAKLKFDSKIIFNDNLILHAFYLKELLKPDSYIYYFRDNVCEVPYFKKHGSRLQGKVIAKADVVLTNSDIFADYSKKFNPNIYMVGSGLDLSLYDESKRKIEPAKEIRKIGSPIIGYAGYITPLRLDIELLIDIAESRPDWNLVLVGPEDEIFKRGKLDKLDNVYFIGNIAPEALPEYIKAFDVAINPQVVNKITNGNYPRKIDEYLSLGKPTVATKTDFMSFFKDYTYLASSKEEFISAIEKALRENDAQKELRRKAFAKQHDWVSYVEKIYESISTTLPGFNSVPDYKHAV